MTLRETIIDFMKEKKDGVATLKEIYKAIDTSDYVSNSDTVHESARAIIYRHPEDFKRVVKGMYLYIGEHSASLLMEGDSRGLSEIEDNSIDCIINDHPWMDKKAHKAGNQADFVNYDTFQYTLEDFQAKARVLKEGSYLVEFLPVESATNWKYIQSVKNMAIEAGFEYYASCIWRKAPEGTINNGRTTKGVEQILVFSKGKPRRLAAMGKPYMTNGMLNYEIDIPIRAKDKNHKAEKPIELYEYLIERFTNEHEVCLDQFGGSCNMAKAAVNLNRFAIVYELCHEFVIKAVQRFKMHQIYDKTIDASEWDSITKNAYRVAKCRLQGAIIEKGSELFESIVSIYQDFLDGTVSKEDSVQKLSFIKAA